MRDTPFFAADLHFGHRAICSFSPSRLKVLGLDKRYVASIIQGQYKLMKETTDKKIKAACKDFFVELVHDYDEAIIEKWNDLVGFSDPVYILGDVSFNHRSETKKYLDRMNGILHLVRGNHDHGTDTLDRWEWVKDYAEIMVGEQVITMMHYPIWEHRNKQYGTWHLFGHVHGKETGIPGKVLDVGMESIGDVAISYAAVSLNMDDLPVIPHHDAEREAAQ